jgi:lipoate-protein ligase A
VTGGLRGIDSGLRRARENLSLTEALLRRRQRSLSPDTLRFQHFPPSAIIGRHQLLHREINLDWVRANGVETARRMTGGGAIVMGPGVLGWELVISRAAAPETLSLVSETICNGVANGLRQLGVDAAYRPRNDVEVQGRKVSGTGGYFDGDCLVFQGTVLVDLDFGLFTSALRLPAHKLGRRGLETLADRVTDLKGLLGGAPDIKRVEAVVADGIAAALGLQLRWEDLSADEEREARAVHDAEIGLDSFVTGADEAFGSEGRTIQVAAPTPGGVIEIAVKLLDGSADMVDQVLITGDFFASPPRVIADLEAHLRHMPLDAISIAAGRFLEAEQASFLGMTAADLCAALTQAASEAEEERA